MTSSSPTPQAPTSGRRIGRYRLVRPLSKGGMALVYEGRRESLAGVSPRVAIKLILPEHAGSETFKELFINEARLGASMQHQNLVQIQDFDCDGETYFLVMEYVEGLTLRKLISLSERLGEPIPLRVVAEIGRQACDGLHYAHTARDEQGRPLNLVHRDIKPSNLILNPQGVAKVLDFGISKGRLREERKGSVKGTWGYMAPEQALGAEVGPTSDGFGLAVVLYELASMRAMFVDQDKDDIRRLLRDDHAARMAATLDGASYGPLIGVLVRALQRDPAGRYADAEAFGRALSALLPDPITARDEVLRFYERLDAIDRGSRPTPRSRAGAGPMSLPSRPPEMQPLSAGSVASFAGGLLLVVLLLTGAAIGLMALFGQVDPVPAPLGVSPEATSEQGRVNPNQEPAGPAGVGAPGERLRRNTPAAAPTSLVQGPVDPVPPAPVAVAPTTGPTGVLKVDAQASFATTNTAEVYIAGQYVAATPATQVLAPGVYTVTLVASDGRRRTFEAVVEADKELVKVWNFDRMEWQ